MDASLHFAGSCAPLQPEVVLVLIEVDVDVDVVVDEVHELHIFGHARFMSRIGLSQFPTPYSAQSSASSTPKHEKYVVSVLVALVVAVDVAVVAVLVGVDVAVDVPVVVGHWP